MKKIERVLAIIIILLDRDTTTTTELAEHFNVTKRTIFRDIETIELAGFPITAKSGRNGGFALMDTFKLSILTFTEEEKELILNALTIKDTIIGKTMEPNVIKEKINLLLSSSPPHINYFSLGSPSVHRPKVETYIKSLTGKISTAIEKKKKISITYIDGIGQKSFRTVQPYKLGMFNGSWFLHAFCEARQNLRFFKISRIRELTILNESFVSDLIIDMEWPTTKKKIIQLEFKKVRLEKCTTFM